MGLEMKYQVNHKDQKCDILKDYFLTKIQKRLVARELWTQSTKKVLTMSGQVLVHTYLADLCDIRSRFLGRIFGEKRFF